MFMLIRERGFIDLILSVSSKRTLVHAQGLGLLWHMDVDYIVQLHIMVDDVGVCLFDGDVLVA